MDIRPLLEKLKEAKASDLLLAAGNPPYLRINASLVKQGGSLLSPEEIEAMVSSLLKREALEGFKNVKELDASYEDDLSRYRINLHFQKGSIAAAIRGVPKKIPALESLGFPKVVHEFTKFGRGLVLVTGPSGCGKSTTQAAMIDLINSSRPCHIITLEDPIEFVHASKQALVEQREVGIDTLTFDAALKRILRQAPDVILVGEMRDLESMQMALTAAETGHLVISTLHTQDAVQSIDRIIDVFPPHQQPQIKIQLAATLQAIISQQLLPRKDGKGLALACEILVVTQAIRNIIRKGSTQDIYSMIELGKQLGMQTMEESLRDLVRNGIIPKEEALTVAVNKERMEKMLGS